MWLLETDALRLHQISDCAQEPYAILSHTWNQNKELSFQQMQDVDSVTFKDGFSKVQRTCSVARSRGFKYVWIDACCIDKKSSAELSEAINSMFRWYQEARLCIVYLSDFLPLPVCSIEHRRTLTVYRLSKCRWFARGWTLQELIASRNIEFYDRDWNFVGHKEDLAETLSQITGISESILSDGSMLHTVPVATKMSWASGRKTTRVEDRAYSLLGIFDVNMPLLYGEGYKAFSRLQQLIADESSDPSLFSWQAVSMANGERQRFVGKFARSPDQFPRSSTVGNQTKSPSLSPPINDPVPQSGKHSRLPSLLEALSTTEVVQTAHKRPHTGQGPRLAPMLIEDMPSETPLVPLIFEPDVPRPDWGSQQDDETFSSSLNTEIPRYPLVEQFDADADLPSIDEIGLSIRYGSLEHPTDLVQQDPTPDAYNLFAYQGQEEDLAHASQSNHLHWNPTLPGLLSEPQGVERVEQAHGREMRPQPQEPSVEEHSLVQTRRKRPIVGSHLSIPSPSARNPHPSGSSSKRQLKNQRPRKKCNPEDLEGYCQTRKLKACIRCRMQRIRCTIDNDNPSGECITCKQYSKLSGKTIHFVPCYRKKLTDASVLFDGINAAVDLIYRPYTGNLARMKKGGKDPWSYHKILYVAFESSQSPLHVFVKDVGTGKKTSVVACAKTVDSFNNYMERDAQYDVSIDQDLVTRMSDIAMHEIEEREGEMDLLQTIFCLRFAMRHITESPFMCTEDGNPIGVPSTRESPPLNILSDLRTVISGFICKYGDAMLAKMQPLVMKASRPNWFTVYTCFFIILTEADRFTLWLRHNREPGSTVQLQQATKNIHAGCNNILIYWHYYHNQGWPDENVPDGSNDKLSPTPTLSQRDVVLEAMTDERVKKVLDIRNEQRQVDPDCELPTPLQEQRTHSGLGSSFVIPESEAAVYWVSQLFDTQWKLPRDD